MTIDKKDLKIIEMLSKNARIPYKNIAEKLGISDVAVIKRIRKLESEEIIRKYTVRIDTKKLGYKILAITGIDVDPAHIFSVIESLKNKENVRYVALSSGDHSIMTIIWAKDNEEIARIHKEISEKEGVKRVCPSIILDVVKENDPLL